MQENFKTAIVWSQLGCTGCETAKKLLISRGYEVLVRDIGHDTGWTKKDLLEQVPHARSVPQVFIEDQYIGGLVELTKYLNK